MVRAYTSPNYNEELVVAKYIGYLGEELTLFEVNAKSQTLKSYPIQPASVDPEHAAKATERKHTAFNQVKIWTRN